MARSLQLDFLYTLVLFVGFITSLAVATSEIHTNALNSSDDSQQQNYRTIHNNENSRNTQNPRPRLRRNLRSSQKRSHHKYENQTKTRTTMHTLIPDEKSTERMNLKDMEQTRKNALSEDPELKLAKNQWIRRLGWWGKSNSYSDPYDNSLLVNPSAEYDWWAQGYRMLGAFISCDFDDGSGDGSGDDDGEGACTRWMMWASYINPNYSGAGRAEYFTAEEDAAERKLDEADCYGDNCDDELSNLDCHSPNTEWLLLGVYRQELYQFYEQISKHLWGYQDYEYVVALAGLAYMTDEACSQVGYTDDGGYLYAGVQPLPGAYISIELYTDARCLTIYSEGDYTYDYFELTSDIELGDSEDNYYGYYGEDAAGYWEEAQEYSLGKFNEVYEQYKYCTTCLDYPSYQDGFYNGDGTEDDDLINQCWKFHSHDSFTCDSACLAMADSQGTILQVKYGDKYYGSAWYGSTYLGQGTSYDHFTKAEVNDSKRQMISTLKANIFITLNSILFIATVIAFLSLRMMKNDNKKKVGKLLLDEPENENNLSHNLNSFESFSENQLYKAPALDIVSSKSSRRERSLKANPSFSSRTSERSKRSGTSKSSRSTRSKRKKKRSSTTRTKYSSATSDQFEF